MESLVFHSCKLQIHPAFRQVSFIFLEKKSAFERMGQDIILVLVIFQRSNKFLFTFFPAFWLIQYQESAMITVSLCFTVNRQKPNTGKPDQITDFSAATARCILLVVLV